MGSILGIEGFCYVVLQYIHTVINRKRNRKLRMSYYNERKPFNWIFILHLTTA